MPGRNRWRTSQTVLARSRELRREMTPAEKLLWRALRNHQISELGVRRQHPIDRFIADFFIPQHKLVIEIDGHVHGEPQQREYDALRDVWFREHGYRVMRFTNDDVLNRFDGVLAAIVAACGG